jgi:hypothetical protein
MSALDRADMDHRFFFFLFMMGVFFCLPSIAMRADIDAYDLQGGEAEARRPVSTKLEL